MRHLVRASLALAVLLVAACGLTGDDGADETTTSTAPSTTASTTTSTTEPENNPSTTDGRPSGLDENDPGLSDLLLTADDIGTDLDPSPEPDTGFDEEVCDGVPYEVKPLRQATV